MHPSRYEQARSAFRQELLYMGDKLADYIKQNGGEEMPPHAARIYAARKKAIDIIALYFDQAESLLRIREGEITDMQNRIREAQATIAEYEHQDATPAQRVLRDRQENREARRTASIFNLMDEMPELFHAWKPTPTA